MRLKKHLSSTQGLSDLLNYAHFVDEGIILNKDGAYMVCYKFRGPDVNSASSGELDALTANINRMVNRLDDGWMLHVDELRVPSLTYPERGAFPSTVAILLDDERRQLYESEGAHYENFQFLTFVWKFPHPLIKTMRHWFVDGVSKGHDHQNLSTLLTYFTECVERCVGLISPQFVLEKLSNEDFLSYLNTCITGDLLPVNSPPDGSFIDVILGRGNVVGGYVPKVGKHHVYVLSLVGYLNEETIPGLLDEMGTYPLIYRWSNRFIPLSEETAEREIKRYRRSWSNKVKGLVGIIKEVVFGTATDKINFDAKEMVGEVDDALTLNRNHSTRYGYWSSEIVFMSESIEVLEQATKDLTRYIEQSGFACIKEDVNALDAWLGTIPGHGSCNVRRLFIHGINLAHLLPLHTVWTGASCSSNASLLPKKSPPVFYAATTGKTPFRFNMDVSDVGHQVVLGPTGSGKSTYLGFLIAQFLRYQDAQIFVFDKDYSHSALTHALDGHHYDIGRAESLSFCPLADLSTETKKVRAMQFIEDLVSLQNVLITPAIRTAIHAAIQALSHPEHKNSRNLTILMSEIQHAEAREALKYYTIEGQISLLDATEDALQTGHLQTFEMNWLLSQKPEIYLPVLGHIFNEIESRLEDAEGKKPTLIVLEESWAYISHPLFAKKLRDWAKTLRKMNARIVFCSQSPSDLYDPSTKTLTATTVAIIESCPTKIYLPNPSMESEIREIYHSMGLSSRQIEIISQVGTPKRHYYIVTPEGNRLIDLGFNELKPIALAFIGLSKARSNDLIACKKQYNSAWVYYWLIQNGFEEWANYWQQHYLKEAA